LALWAFAAQLKRDELAARIAELLQMIGKNVTRLVVVRRGGDGGEEALGGRRGLGDRLGNSLHELHCVGVEWGGGARAEVRDGGADLIAEPRSNGRQIRVWRMNDRTQSLGDPLERIRGW